jgi:hypothetical protein
MDESFHVFPPEITGLLSAAGRRLMAGRHLLAGALRSSNFVAAKGLLDARLSRAIPELLKVTFEDLLVPLEQRTPDAFASQVMGGELLRKTVRVLTTPTANPPDPTLWKRANDCGLVPMLQSTSFRRFIEALAGFALVGPAGMQVLCYRPGDYAGPHTDHMPHLPDAKGGYLDIHLTFCTPGVKRQLIVYEQGGHFAGVQELTTTGMVTAYRLPFWHYTTPLEGSPNARRWLVLASFLRSLT